MRICEALEGRVLLSRTWIVAPTGKNSNPGTLSQPLQTIQQAANLARPGDTVLIRAGVYRETVTPPQSGTAAAPITFMPYNNESVTLSGADPVSGFSDYRGSVYQTTQSWDLGSGDNQVFVDGRMINEARWPNTSLDVSHPTFATASAIATGSAGTGWLFPSTATLSDSALPGGAGAWNGATVHIAAGQGWVVQSGSVLGSSAGSATFSFLHLTSFESPAAGNHFYLTGSFQALDAAGEWYRDPTTARLYVWTPAGDSPARHLIEAKHRQFAFELSGRSYINIQGLHLFAASVDTDAASNHLTLSGLSAQYVSQSTTNPLPWDDNNPPGTSGILLNGSYNVLQNSTIAFSSGNGVSVTGSHDTVQNCVIHDVDYAGGDGAGVHVSGSSQVVQNNTIYNAARDGILCTYSSAGKIVHNTIHDAMLQTTDGGGVYAWGTNGGGTEIAFNTIYNVRSGGYGSAGVYLDNGCSNFVIHDNSVWNTNFNIKVNPPSHNNMIYNSGPVLGRQSAAAPTGGSQNGPVTDLGTLGGWESVANAVNNLGKVAGQSSTGQSLPASLLDGKTSSNMGALGGNYSTATAINSNGQMAGSTYTARGARHAFVDAGRGIVDLGTLSGDVGSYATGINALQQVVGTSYNAVAAGHAFVYSGGRMLRVAGLGGGQSAATGINDGGQIVGFSTLADNRTTHAFLTTIGGTARDLGTLGGTSSYGLAVNNRGQVVGQSLVRGDRFFHAFLYSNGRMTDLGSLPNLPNSVATAVNNNGDVVGYAYSADFFTWHAFLYRNGVMYDLNTLVPNTGWTFTTANGINDQDQIVGGGNNRAGVPRAFLLSI